MAYPARSGPNGQRQRSLVVLTFCLAAALGLSIAGLEILQRKRVPPDALASGPLHNGLYFLLPLLCAFLYMLFASIRIAKQLATRESLPVAVGLFSGQQAMVTIAVLSICAAASLYGVRAYWAAGDKGIIVQELWGQAPLLHPWSEVTSRSLSCYRSKSGVHPNFYVTLRDGEHFNLVSSSPTTNFIQRAPILLELTDGVTHSQVGDLAICPGRIARLFAGH
jgi:hypothetical protein